MNRVILKSGELVEIETEYSGDKTHERYLKGQEWARRHWKRLERSREKKTS